MIAALKVETLPNFAQQSVALCKPTKADKRPELLRQLQQLREQGVNLDQIDVDGIKRILDADSKHQNSKLELERLLGISVSTFDYQDREGELQNIIQLGRHKAVIALGGDGFFVQVARSLAKLQLANASYEDVYLLGVNSDPEHSTGAILAGSIKDLERNLESLDQNIRHIDLRVVGIYLDDKLIDIAISDINLGATDDSRVSKYKMNGKSYATSGLLTVTGVNSTWFANAGGSHFPMDSNFLKCLSRESGASSKVDPEQEHQSIKISFTRSAELTLAVDGFTKYRFEKKDNLLDDFKIHTIEYRILPQTIKAIRF